MIEEANSFYKDESRESDSKSTPRMAKDSAHKQELAKFFEADEELFRKYFATLFEYGLVAGQTVWKQLSKSDQTRSKIGLIKFSLRSITFKRMN